MLGKGVTLGDVLVVIAIVLPVSLLIGAALGYFGDRFGLSGSIRVGVILTVTAAAGQVARVILRRRVKARSTPLGRQG